MDSVASSSPVVFAEVGGAGCAALGGGAGGLVAAHPAATRLRTAEVRRRRPTVILRFDQGRASSLDDVPHSSNSPSARLSNRVYSRSKRTFTVPVGPLRCLAMISSATFGSVVDSLL